MLLIKARLFLQFPIHSILSSRRQRSKSVDHHSKSICTPPSPLKHNAKRRSATRMGDSWRLKWSCGHLGEITHTTKCKHRIENQKTPRKISDWVVSQNELKCIWETKTVDMPDRRTYRKQPCKEQLKLDSVAKYMENVARSEGGGEET